MEYGPDGSGAAAGDYDYPSVVSALPDYFDYKSDIDFFWRAQFTPYGWRTLLEGQLDNGRPVIYRGTGEVGHAFVCDGYQGVEYYHFNWGWSGNFDGYYYLYSLAPGDHDFYFDHGAVVNIRPDVPLTPGEIEDLKLTLSGDDVTLEWTAIEGADGYSVYRSVIPYGQSGVLLETITGNMITLTDELQFYSEAYYYVTVVYDGEVSDMTLIPAGTFLMGSSDGDYWEQPIHQVTLTNDFYLGTHEVTNEEYRFALQWAYDNDHLTATENTVQAHGEELLDLDSQNCEISFSAGTFRLIMRTHSLEDGTQGPGVAYPSGYSPLNHPVKEVSWFGAACYCDWLSMMDGFDAFYDGNWDQTEEHNPYISPSYRLPTEAEREYAASFNDSRIYPWGDEPPIPCEQANHELCIGWTSPVGSFPLGNSQLGLQDIAGNLWEWTGDWYDSDYYDFNPITDPLGPVDGSYRVQRGASWHNLGIYLRCADRSYNWPFITTNFIGFRIAQRVNEMHIMRGK
jgi:formylglycine-generating enzyme required for sulfatase activity